MPIDSLHRIIWLLREQYPNQEKYTLKQVRLAIEKERGYDERTFKRVLRALLEHKFLKRTSRYWFIDVEYTHTKERQASGLIDMEKMQPRQRPEEDKDEELPEAKGQKKSPPLKEGEVRRMEKEEESRASYGLFQ